MRILIEDTDEMRIILSALEDEENEYGFGYSCAGKKLLESLTEMFKSTIKDRQERLPEEEHSIEYYRKKYLSGERK